KTVTFVVAIGIIASLIFAVSSRGKKAPKGHIEVSKLNEKFEEMRDILRDAMLDPEELKQQDKAEKKRFKEEKAEQKRAAKLKAESAKKKVAGGDASAIDVVAEPLAKKRVFVLDF